MMITMMLMNRDADKINDDCFAEWSDECIVKLICAADDNKCNDDERISVEWCKTSAWKCIVILIE